MNSNDGVILEDRVQEILESLQQYAPAFVHRYTDTKAARNFVRPAPADFLFACPSGAYSIECKSSVEATLAKAWKDDERHRVQIAKHRYWIRAGQESLFFFWHVGSSIINAHPGQYVIEAVLAGGRAGALLWKAMPQADLPFYNGLPQWADFFRLDLAP